MDQGGIWALTGYLYQLLGTAVQAFHIPSKPHTDDSSLELLVYPETWGQDAVFLNPEQTNVVQFKHSSVDAEIKPAELYEICIKLHQSIEAVKTATVGKIVPCLYTIVTNPGQDDRVQVILQAIHLGFREQKQAFNLDKILEPVECNSKDVEVATRQYYQSFVGRHWTNGLPDEKQMQLIAWVAARLKLKPQDVESINLRVAETNRSLIRGKRSTLIASCDLI